MANRAPEFRSARQTDGHRMGVSLSKCMLSSIGMMLLFGNPLSTEAFPINPQRISIHNSQASPSKSNRIDTFHMSTATTQQTRLNDSGRRRQKTKPMPVTGYDGKTIDNFYDRRPLQVGWRLNSLGFPLLGWYLGLLMDNALGISDKPDVQRKRGAELRELLVRSRSVALIKSGQALSLRPDLIRNKIWAEELGKLVDAVGAFDDSEAMRIMKKELEDLAPRMKVTRASWKDSFKKNKAKAVTKLEKYVANDPILSLFEFSNGNQAVASASIGQVYKARIRRGPQLEAAIGKDNAAKWGGKVVAIKIQRPDVTASAALDMYLLRRTAMWASKMRGGDLPKIADQFGLQLFGELDYVREANNCERFRELYGYWKNVLVPDVCNPLTRRRVLVQEWVEGEKGPWPGQSGLETVQIGIRCSVDQLMTTGLFHADPHRGNLLKTQDGNLAFLDYGMMADIDEEDRYGLFGLVIGLQNKDLPLITENLLKLGFLKDTAQLDILVPRLRKALKKATGGTGKASDVSFARLQAELDEISRENVLQFSTPPFFTIILRSLTILEGVALSVDPKFRLVRGSYPYVLNQLLSPDDNQRTPAALQKLLIRLLTINGEEKEIDWERLRDLLQLAQKARSKYNPSDEDKDDDRATLSRQTIDLFFRFLTSKTGLFLKRPLVHELAQAIDGMASIGEARLLTASRGLLPTLPGMKGPVNERVMSEMQQMLDTFQDALTVENTNGNESSSSSSSFVGQSQAQLEAMRQVIQEVSVLVSDDRLREDAGPLLEEVRSVIQLVAVEVLEIRGSRAVRSIMGLEPVGRNAI
mmetsp:Transcript_18187/g.45027  ORF Transcript_18187/g.45027 Transcript_18187/m.45027 type:complete len:812 (+) Transcript_18187:155-2590(+)|eukprot:CAMPEP_0113646102 /NCGR_PEP_ID=MMETSP0017_2-20120614/24335_1 /TAXON_ID=2856 /ORGANISM="Cylindrotheca closterium" /LENGTH=811 /DNA_ID=CAMNT_0000557943 /DNA_START=118 /DNA_END=2553 /DNA_ORIENTATION=+ /assembly_acc=CAM_ASM_000147